MKKKYYWITLIVFIIIVLICAYLWINSIVNEPAYNETYPYEDIYKIPKNIQINFSFLLQPFTQQTPRIFTNEEWKLLPLSQSNVLMNDSLAVCGRGGLYIYNMTSDNTDYIYRQDWYPCYNIYFLNYSMISVEDLLRDGITYNRQNYIGERVTFDIIEKKIISNETISEDDVLNRYNSYLAEHGGIWNNDTCNEDNSTCVRLYHDKIVTFGDKGGKISILYNNGSIQNTGINNAIDLVGFKDNILFYAVDCSYGSALDDCLYVYDINRSISEMLLSSFRYDSETMIFFPEK